MGVVKRGPGIRRGSVIQSTPSRHSRRAVPISNGRIYHCAHKAIIHVVTFAFFTRVAYLKPAGAGPREGSSAEYHHPLRGYMARHRALCPRVRSHECNFSQRRPLPQAAAKEQGYSTAWLAGANRASPVLAVARKYVEEGGTN